jgi:hypothetical protein
LRRLQSSFQITLQAEISEQQLCFLVAFEKRNGLLDGAGGQRRVAPMSAKTRSASSSSTINMTAIATHRLCFRTIQFEWQTIVPVAASINPHVTM